MSLGLAMPLNRRGLLLGIGGAALAQSAWASPRPHLRDNAILSPTDAAAFEAETRGRLGVAIHDLGSGRLSAWAAEERFPLNSTVKFLLAALLLRIVDQGQLRLDDRIRLRSDDIVTWSPVTEQRVGTDMSWAEICAATLQTSDNTAANLLIHRLGGAEACTARLRALDDPTTRIDRLEPELNLRAPNSLLDTTTPAMMLHHLHGFLLADRLRPDSRAQLLDWMVQNQTGDRRLRAGLPADWRVADRTGTSRQGDSATIAMAMPPGRAPVLIAVYMSETGLLMRQMDQIHARIARHIAPRITAR